MKVLGVTARYLSQTEACKIESLPVWGAFLGVKLHGHTRYSPVSG